MNSKNKCDNRKYCFTIFNVVTTINMLRNAPPTPQILPQPKHLSYLFPVVYLRNKQFGNSLNNFWLSISIFGDDFM